MFAPILTPKPPLALTTRKTISYLLETTGNPYRAQLMVKAKNAMEAEREEIRIHTESQCKEAFAELDRQKELEAYLEPLRQAVLAELEKKETGL